MSLDPFAKTNKNKKWRFMTEKNKENLLSKDVFFQDSLRFQKNQTHNFVEDFSNGKNFELTPDKLDLLDKEINSYSNKIQKLQQLKATKNFSNFSLFKTTDAKNNNFIQTNNSQKSKKELPSRKTDQYKQYKELKLFRQMSNDHATIQEPSETVRAKLSEEDDSHGKTLRNAASHGILGNGSFVRSNNLNGIRLDMENTGNRQNSGFKTATQRVRFDLQSRNLDSK